MPFCLDLKHPKTGICGLKLPKYCEVVERSWNSEQQTAPLLCFWAHMSCIANARLYGFTYQVASMPTVGECIGFWVDAARPFTRIKTSPHRTHQDSQGGEMSKALRFGKDVSEVSKKCNSLALLKMLKILMVNRTFQNHPKCCRTPPLGRLVVIVPIPSLANQVGHATIYFLSLVDGWMTDELVWTSTYCIWWQLKIYEIMPSELSMLFQCHMTQNSNMIDMIPLSRSVCPLDWVTRSFAGASTVTWVRAMDFCRQKGDKPSHPTLGEAGRR